MSTILIVTDNLGDQINGVVTTFKNIEIYAKAAGYNIVYLDPRKFAYIGCPGYPEVKLSWPKGIGRKIKEINPDFIHIATEGPVGFAARVYCEWNNLRYNTSYHTKFPEFLNKMYHIPEFLTYAYLRWFHKNSNCVLTTTDTMVHELRHNRFTATLASWTRGVDRTIFSDKLRNNIRTLEPRLLSVGRVSKEKGLDDFCKLPYKNKTIVGDGPYRAELESRYPDVKFVGIKQGKELAEYYANADVFVFPSRTDTFGIVIIESLACGTPVAAYPVAGPIDILQNGVTGYMNDNLSDAIQSCSALNRNKVIKESNKWSWQNCWDIFQQNLVKVHKN